MGELLVEPHTLSSSVRESNQVRSPVSAGRVGRPMAALQIFLSIRDFVLLSNPMLAKSVQGPLGSGHSERPSLLKEKLYKLNVHNFKVKESNKFFRHTGSSPHCALQIMLPGASSTQISFLPKEQSPESAEPS